MGDHAGLGAEVSCRIGADDADRLGRFGLEQDVVNDRLVLEGDGGDGCWHGEVRRGNRGPAAGRLDDRQATGRDASSPGTWAVPVATAVVGNADHATVIMHCSTWPAERCGAACLDGGHDAALVGQEPTALGGTERIAVAAEDVRHLHRGTHVPLLGRNYLERELIERARRPGDQSGRDSGHSGPSSPG